MTNLTSASHLSQLAARRVDSLGAVYARLSGLKINSNDTRMWARRQAAADALSRAERVEFERSKEVEFLAFQEEVRMAA